MLTCKAVLAAEAGLSLNRLRLGLNLCLRLGLRWTLGCRWGEQGLWGGAKSRVWSWWTVRWCCLGRSWWAETWLGLLHFGLSGVLSWLSGSWLLPLCGAGHLGERRLLESGRLEGLVWGGGTTGDGRTQKCVQVGAAAHDGRGRCGWRCRGGSWRRCWADGLSQTGELLSGSEPCVWRVIKQSSKLHFLVADELQHVWGRRETATTINATER